jgi:predicted RNase H-like HicB family nuclease
MNYPVLITKKSTENSLASNYTFSVVDLPGCQTTAKTMDEGLAKLNDVITSHLSILVEYGEQVPHAQSIEFHMKNTTDLAPIWAMIAFDIVPFLGKSQKINVTLPELLIKRIDDRVNKSSDYKSRSGFIAQACMTELAIS